MKILTDYGRPYLLDSLTGPVVPSHYWIFSGEMQDYTLAMIHFLEETTGPTITVEIMGVTLDLPASWHIMVADEGSCDVDTVPLHQCSRNAYKALLMSPTDNKIRLVPMKVLDLHKSKSLVHPMMEKGTMFVRPIKEEYRNNTDDYSQLCITIGPTDLSSKYISEMGLGDLVY